MKRAKLCADMAGERAPTVFDAESAGSEGGGYTHKVKGGRLRAMQCPKCHLETPVFMVFVSVLLAGCSITNLSRQDPGGWRDAKWGMTGPEILKAFAGEAILLREPEQYKNAFASVGIDNMMMPGFDEKAPVLFKVRFLLDSTTKKLFQVTITSNSSVATADADHAYETLRAGVFQRYGVPTVTPKRSDTREEVWLFPSTVIRLSSTNMKPLRFSLVALTFRDAETLEPGKF
jgi:hypothetical protein